MVGKKVPQVLSVEPRAGGKPGPAEVFRTVEEETAAMSGTRKGQNVEAHSRESAGGTVTPVDDSGGTLQVSSPGTPARRNNQSRNNSQDAKRARAIPLMLKSTSVVEVAATMGVHRSTVHRWLADPDFQHELSERRDDFLERTFDLQAYASTLAATRLIELLDSPDERVALRAAQTLVAAARTYVLIDQERRVRRLEENLPFILPGAY